ncbi:MAG: glycoside hydrolase family 5 protein [Pseudomonadota bacterium]|nr:glycoside hydrolase family 5 protein [Pseudomonadota bacterium]
MQRREFSQALAALAALGLPPAALAAGQGAQARPAVMGTNLSGMEWARPGLRYGLSTAPNLHFTVPRKADVAYLAACGFTQNRLPIQWELLQPMLHDTQANAAARALIGEPGHFHADYAAFITGVLDAHAAVGIRCILDLHNYARYQDFRYQGDGSVIGLTAPPTPLLRPYTRDNAQVYVRIFGLAPAASLTPAHFVDFWRRAATQWRNHPGLGGYGLMNEPHDLPEPGGVTESANSREDLSILPVFMQAAIDAIRALDPLTPIYVAGNEWGGAVNVATKNPAYPLSGDGLVYEVHTYLDRRSTGHAFDWETEVAPNSWSLKRQSAPITTATGRERVKVAVDWARARKVRLALGEIGMPIDDPRWAQSFRGAVELMLQNGFEVYSWMGGSHWPIRNYALNHVPGWHQGRTLEPLVSGVMKAAAGIAQAALFDDGPGYASAGTPVTITVYARGSLARPLRLKVAVQGGGKLSKSQLTIAAGPNGQDSYTYTPAADEVASLRYISDGQLLGQVPPPRRVYSLTDPVAHAASSLEDAAMAIIAKYSACHWDMADGYTDYVLGKPAGHGQVVRAVSDSGYGSSPGNAMEMLNWANKDSPAMGRMALPVMRVSQGRKSSWHGGGGTFGLWCKKSAPMAGVQPEPKNRVPYHLEDAHFVVAAVSLAALESTGLVFQASMAEAKPACELGLRNGQPMARWLDAGGQLVQLLGPDKLALNTPSVLTLTSAPAQQALRVNSAVAAQSRAKFAPSLFSQMLIGWGYANYYPQDGFSGHIHAVITGKGVPLPAELAILERYLDGKSPK